MHNPYTSTYHCYSLSETAITIEFGKEISEDLLETVTTANKLVQQAPFSGLVTTVSAYASLTVFYDPLLVMASNLKGSNCFEKVSGYFAGLLSRPAKNITKKSDIITLPVCYGGKHGPDLEDVASYHDISVDEVIHLHSNAIYKVYMIGFLPGFAYMGGLTAQLATPRKAMPRSAVPAGSVGIAGQQTGVYPLQSPGGWQLIGQTPVTLFDINKNSPALLKAGDNVVFKPITADEFKALAK